MFITNDSPLVLAAAALSGRNQPQSGLRALDQSLRRDPGHKLFTVLAIDSQANTNRRLYSSVPDAYPCEGTKPLGRDSEFYRAVFLAGEPRICRNRDECRAAFPDYELIEALGCESAVNVPIRWNGTTLGSLNLLHERHWYDVSCLTMLTLYAILAVPVLLHVLTNSSNPLERQ